MSVADAYIKQEHLPTSRGSVEEPGDVASRAI